GGNDLGLLLRRRCGDPRRRHGTRGRLRATRLVGLGAVGVGRALVLLSAVGVRRALLAHLTLLACLVLAAHLVLAHLIVMALHSRATLLRGLADRAALVLVAAHFILALRGRAALVGRLADRALFLAALHVLSFLAGAGRLLGLAGLH